jgi:uncharacterized membrane protein YdjX (TVP38/TMEM64 family)
MKEKSSPGKGAIFKALLLVVFIAVAVYVVRFTAVKDLLTVERMKHFLDTSGLWAPVIFIAIYTVGICLFVPGTVLTTIGAAIFGAYWGFLYVLIAAILGASAAFFIGRYLGRDFAASVIGDRLRRYDEAIERNGFATVLYLRLIYFPFTAMNFGMGLTRVRFRDYFWGTVLGIIAGTFIITFFVGTIKEVWAGGDWSKLWSFKVVFSVALFVFSLFIPKIIKKVKKAESHADIGRIE